MCADLKLKEDTKSILQSAEDMSQNHAAQQQSASPAAPTSIMSPKNKTTEFLRCACHARYGKIKKILSEIVKRYRSTKHTYDPRAIYLYEFYHARIKALTGIVAGSPDCTSSECLCHTELELFCVILHARQKDLSNNRDTLKQQSSEDNAIFEIYAGEIEFSCALLRDYDGTKLPSARDKQREITMKALPLGIALSVLGFVVAYDGWLF